MTEEGQCVTAASDREIFKIQIKSRRLDTILSEHEKETTSIDFLAIDVEGWELSVLEGFSIDVYKPKVVIMENLFERQDQRDSAGPTRLSAHPRVFVLEVPGAERGLRGKPFGRLKGTPDT